MTLTNDDLDVLSTRAAQCMGSTVEIDRVDLAALVAEVRASRTLTAPERDDLGRIVRDEWMAWAREQPNPKPSWLVEWDRLSEPDREVDRRIGERLFAAGRSAERGARMLASPPAPVEPSTWTPEDAERRAREMLGEGVPLPSPPAPVEDARPVLTEWKPWSGEDDLGYACEVRDAKCDAGPLKQLVQADVLGRWWVYESSNPLDDTALARGTAPDLATAKAAADAAACQWYRLPDDAPAAPDAFPRAPRDDIEERDAVTTWANWCNAECPTNAAMTCTRSHHEDGSDHVVASAGDLILARWPAAPATTGGEDSNA